jgi:hypothetical protein
MRILSTSLFFTLILSLGSCIHDPISPIPKSPQEINLKWNASYPEEKMENAVIGLFWCLSHLGAKNTNPNSSGIEVTANKIHINTSYLGFSETGKTSIESLHQSIINSPEYIHNNSIDLGRYITLLVGASNHYYKITEVPETLGQQIAKYTLRSEKGFVNNSTISKHHRSIQFSSQEGLNKLFLSTELDSITANILEFETMELMKNGQFRYAIFDSDSHRISSALTDGGNAGKPAKCMWCHESNINPSFNPQNDYLGYLTFQQLQDTLLYFRSELKSKQGLLINGVNFLEKRQHTQMELQYIMFKQPSPMRLANEWNISISEVEQLLVNEPMVDYHEFSFLPLGYIRNNIEKYAPAKGLLTSEFVREKSPLEVNYID